jgi:prephenate dehydrogenase
MSPPASSRPTLGIIGFGAFGRLMAEHLRPHFRLCAYDPVHSAGAEVDGVPLTTLRAAAGCAVVALAVPVNRLAEVVASIGPHLRPDALVLDVGSVKVVPAKIMRRGLPPHVGIIATHPLFGPQSARGGIAGLKIAICPVRGPHGRRVGAFLHRALGLRVIFTTPEAHDREAAMVQGLTHLIARVLVQMEPLPSRMTTRSFELLMQGVAMVRDDAEEVFRAIEQSNPYSREVRRRFFDLASALDAKLEADPPGSGAPASSPDVPRIQRVQVPL